MPPLDRFSSHADLYAQYRIDYPAELYTFLLSAVAHRQRAWDCATGNGQVAAVLATHFAEVDATDISQPQLDQAIQRPNVSYRVSPAERTPFPDQHFDLITVAQALHWFDADAFHAEVRRVAKPGAVIAEWGYDVSRVNATIDLIFDHFYNGLVGPYWDPNRRHIEDHYARIPFPFAQVQQPGFTIRRAWTAGRFLNYLRTWSSVQKYIREHGNDPVDLIADELTSQWGPEEREVQFPVFLRMGVVE